MKRNLILSFLLVLSVCGYAQEFTENFEDPWIAGTGPNTGSPGGWGIYDNGIGPAVNWVRSTAGNVTQPVYEGSHAAYLNREQVAPGSMAEDWLVTKLFTAPQNAQVRFFSRLSVPNNQGNSYEVKISSDPVQGDLDAYTTLVTWTEDQINPVYDVYTEKTVDIPEAYFGEQVYIALVMRNNNGDRWLVDSFSVVEKCMPPVDITIPAEDITLNSAVVNWEAGEGTEWEVEAVPVDEPFTGNTTFITSDPFITLPGLEDSTTYKVRIRATCEPGSVSDWSTPVNFTTLYTAPDNDECQGAIALTVNPTPTCATLTQGTLIQATASGQANTCTGTADDDVWFEFTATATTHIINLTNISENQDLVHAVYQNTCGSLTLRYCSDPNTSNAINLTIGTTYKVRVYSKTDTPQTTSFNICVTTPLAAPVNDECANAATVSVNPGENCIQSTPGTIQSATASAEPNSCGGSDDDDIWFQFTATATAHTISLENITGGTPDLYHVVYEGDNCGSLTQLYCSNPETSLATGLTIGQVYKIRVYSFTGTTGQTTSFEVCVSTPPPAPVNDECANATVLTVNPTLECAATTQGTVQSATPSGQPNTCGGTPNDDVWYEFTATNTTHAISLLNISGSTTNLYHSVYEGSSCDALTLLYCSDPNTSTAQGLTIGTTYTVRVYTFTPISGQSTAFDICIGTPPVPPVNDDCNNAVTIPVNPTDVCTETVSGTVLSAMPSPEANTCTGNADDDVWFEFTATSTSHSIKLLNIAGSTVDMFHTVYAGSDCNTLEQLYCSDPNASVALNLTIGQTYKVRVYTVTATPGQNTTFDICVGTPPPPPANDDCENAVTVPVNTGSECVQAVPGTIYSATPSVQDNNCTGTADDDIWYEFTATNTNHNISIQNVTGGTSSLVHVLYRGDDCENLEVVYCSSTNNSTASYLILGETYTIRVFSFTADPGQTSSFEVCVTTPSQPIFTDDTYTPVQIVEDILIGSACANVSNITWKTGNTDGNNFANGIAYFEDGASDFEIQRGVILSTGEAYLSRGPNTSELSDGDEAWTGDTQLRDYIHGLGIDPDMEEHYNATVLEFDFVPLTDHISFPFIFASEEYGTYQCAFSDSFAFFLTNTETGETTNLAVLPGTEIPISVVTIRDDANDNCDPANPEYYGQNNQFENAAEANINYNGQTVMLTAESDVAVNTVYHIKLVIADRGDEQFDSAVFIGPFDIGNINLGDDLLVDTLTALCEGETYVADSGLDPALYDITWFRNGEVIEGENGPEITITQPGEYTIEAHYISSTCTAVQTLVVEYYEPVNNVTGNPVDLVLCNTNGTGEFNLTDNDTVILEGLNADDYTITYHLTEGNAEDNTEPLDAVFESDTAEQLIYVRIFNNLTGCLGTKSFRLVTLSLNPEFELDAYCNGTVYSLRAVALGDGFNPETAVYSWAGPDNFTSTQPEIEIAATGDYTLTVTTEEGCEVTSQITVAEIQQCLIPRGISPNGDGLNESFDLSGMDVEKLSIFNRYGQEVYALENYSDEWGGNTSDGEELPTGTYFYSIQQRNGENKTGWVYINRSE